MEIYLMIFKWQSIFRENCWCAFNLNHCLIIGGSGCALLLHRCFCVQAFGLGEEAGWKPALRAGFWFAFVPFVIFFVLPCEAEQAVLGEGGAEELEADGQAV